MTVTYQENARNAACDAITALIDVSSPGSFEIGTAGFASILAVCTMNATAYGAAAAGVAAMNGTPTDPSADNGGVAAVYRARDGADVTVWDGPVALSGGGDINLGTAARNAGLDASLALCNGGDIQFATDSGFGTILATVSCQATAFASAVAGVAALDTTGMSTTIDAGTVTAFRIRTSGGAEVLRGTVATSGSDWNWDNNVVVQDQPIVVQNLNASMPATIASSDGALVINNINIVAGQNVEVTSGSYTQPAQLV